MTKKLYVIGNGFDLHHNLNTSYYDFANYLRKKYNDIYNTLERYVSYPTSEKDLWSRFEDNLANLDAEEILSENTDTLPNYASDDFRDRDIHAFPDIMDEHYRKLTDGLLSAFEEFIRQVEFPNYSWEHKLIIDKEAKFLTFNYTNTLEELYSIDKTKINYIHNSAFYGSDKIILGHGIDPKAFEEKRPDPPEDFEPEELEEWHNRNDNYDYSYDEGKQILMRYFKDTYKPTKEVINRNSSFFKSLSTIEEVYVFGHSMSSVDLPYFKTIVNSINKNVNWTVSFYNSYERKKHLMTLKKLGIEEKNIVPVRLKDLQEINRQLKFEFDISTTK